jgi:hypothetical protein
MLGAWAKATIEQPRRCVRMNTALKNIGERLQRIFGDPLKRPAGWNLIDAFARLEEREEALQDRDQKADEGTSLEAQKAGHPRDNEN